MATRISIVLAVVLVAGIVDLLSSSAGAVLVEFNVSGTQEQVAGTTLSLVDRDAKAVPEKKKREDRAAAWLWDVPAGTYTIQATDATGKRLQQTFNVPETGKVSGSFDAGSGAFVVSAEKGAAIGGFANGESDFTWSVGPSVFVFQENRRLTAGFRPATVPPGVSVVDLSTSNNHLVAAPLLDLEGRWRMPAVANTYQPWLLFGLMAGAGWSGDFSANGVFGECLGNSCTLGDAALRDKRTGLIWAPYLGVGSPVANAEWIFGEFGLWAEHHKSAAIFQNQIVVSQNQSNLRPFLGVGARFPFALANAGETSFGLGAYYLFAGGRTKTEVSQLNTLFSVEAQSRGSLAGMAQFNLRF